MNNNQHGVLTNYLQGHIIKSSRLDILYKHKPALTTHFKGSK